MRAIYHFFLHQYTSSREDFTRGQLIIAFSLIEALISSIYFLVHPLVHFHVPRWLFLMFSVAIIIALFSFFLFRSLNLLAHLMITVLWAGFCIGIAYSGGIYSLVLPWLAMMPVMANLLVNQQAAFAWTIISLASVVFFFYNYADVKVILDPSGDYRALVANMGLVIIVCLFTWLFHNSRTSLLQKVAAKNRKLEKRKNRLVEQHTEIVAQQEFIARQNEQLAQQYVNIERINRQLEQRVRETARQNQTLERHWQTLLSISKSYAINFGELSDATKYITQTAVESLQIDRVSIWRYVPECHEIQCLLLFDKRPGFQQEEQHLHLSEYPSYFDALMRENVIPVVSARTDPATYELKEKYLVPRKIVSMMDSPFFLDGKLGGVLCCEHSVDRPWGHEDILFAQALSDIITLAFKAQEQRIYQRVLQEKQEEIIRANQSLEQRVQERTEELERQNHQLAEYAYINSHLLRAPLSRLLGLVNLTRYPQISGSERELIIEQIKMAGHELDDVVARINEALGFKSPFTRDFFATRDNQKNQE